MRIRLREFMESRDISAAELADRIGVQRSNVSHILNGRNNPGAQFLEKLLLSFPDLNANWLITGKGRMTGMEAAPLPTDETSPVDSEKAPAGQFRREPSDNSHSLPAEPGEQGIGTPPLPEIKKQVAATSARIVIFHSDLTYSEYFPR